MNKSSKKNPRRDPTTPSKKTSDPKSLINGGDDTNPEAALTAEELEKQLQILRPATPNAADEAEPRLASPIGYVRKHGGLPATKKSLGQNWLTDSEVVHSIAESLYADQDELVVEIGPGTGALTEQLLANGNRVIAVDIDRRMIDHLTERWGESDQLTLVHADIMKLDIAKITNGTPFKLIGNLPYNITSSLIFKLLDEFRLYPALITRFVVLLQYEVAVRLVAQPGESEASVLSLLLRFWGEPDLALKVPKESFHPRPKVDAGLLAMDIAASPLHPVDHWPTLLKLVKGTFSKRRKMLRNSVPGIVGIRPIEGVDFDWTRRPQTLSAGEYAWLAEQLAPNREQ